MQVHTHSESGEVRSRSRAIFGTHNLGKLSLRCGCERGYTSFNVILSFEELFARRREPAKTAQNFGYGLVTSTEGWEVAHNDLLTVRVSVSVETCAEDYRKLVNHTM